MIKIIKEGNTPNNKIKITKCPSCSTKFSYENSDIIKNSTSLSDNFGTIQCPLCKGYFKPNDLVENIVIILLAMLCVISIFLIII